MADLIPHDPRPDIFAKFSATLSALWRGDVPLRYTFWLYYFVVVLVLSLLARAGGAVFSLLAIVWAGFMVVPIIRSADKYPGPPIRALLAKVMAALIALMVLTDLIHG